MSVRTPLRAVCHLLGILLSIGCSSGDDDIGIELIDRYHRLQHTHVDTTASQEIDAYLDYSLGMGEGMRATASHNAALQNFLAGRTVSYYRVGQSAEPTPIDIMSSSANFMDLANFRDRGSRLKEVMDRIVAAPRRSSVFITDFERILPDARQMLPGAPAPHPIDASAWAQEHLRRWLLAGHRVDVFAHRYSKPDAWFGGKSAATQENWIYTIVFTPAPILKDPLAYASSALAFLLEEHGDKQSPQYRHYWYWADAFRVDAKNDAAIGNANPNLALIDFQRGTGRPAHDLHVIDSEDLRQFAEGDELGNSRTLLAVRIRSEVPFLSAIKYGVKVRDATGALRLLRAADTDAAARVQKGPENAVDTPTSATRGPSRAKSVEAVTRAAAASAAIDSVFAHVFNEKTGELGIMLKSDFVGVTEPTVYQVDVVVTDAMVGSFSDAREVLTLNYSGGYQIHALGESIRLAVRDVASAMRGKVLYSFYVKIEP